MVQGIMEDRKVMTRRIVKPQIEPCKHYLFETEEMKNEPTTFYTADGLHRCCSVCGNGNNYRNKFEGVKCPCGQVGDVLYVRETFTKVGGDADGNDIEGGIFLYKADGEKAQEHNNIWGCESGRWFPSIHMPKSAARIWLEITDISVERVQDITAEDARDEGIYREWDDTKHWYKNYSTIASMLVMPRESFMTLWMSINGVESWEANPWVWVVSFRVLSKTGKPTNL